MCLNFVSTIIFLVERFVDRLVLMKEGMAKAFQPLLQEHIHERVAERIFNDLVPRF